MMQLSLWISPELHQRLEECARQTKQKKTALAQAALEAAIEAIEENGFRLVIPMKFLPAEIATANPAAPEKSMPRTSYPSHRSQVSLAEDVPAKVAKPKKAA